MFGPETEVRLLPEFRRAAAEVPAYRALLEEHGVPVDQVRDLASFSRLCPLLSHANTFERFPLDQLSVGGALRDVADVLTSSGHGGRFSFGVISRTAGGGERAVSSIAHSTTRSPSPHERRWRSTVCRWA